MSEGSFSPEELAKDIKKAQAIKEKKGRIVTNPLASFNMSLNNLNPDWQPSPESELKPAQEHKPSDELLEESKSPEKIVDPETGQEFNVLRLNWDKFIKSREKRVLIYLPQYNNSIDDGASHYRILELARQIDTPILAIDHPQMGKSDKLTGNQVEALKTDIGYGLIAEAELRVMQSLGIKEIDLVGISMGAWASVSIAEVAEKYGIKVKNIVMVDTPGIKEVSPGYLTKAEMKEGQHLDLYLSSPYDPEMRRSHGLHKSKLKQNVDLTKWALSILKNDPKGVYKKAMAKGTISSNLKRALNSNQDLKVSIIRGSESMVSPGKETNEMVKRLRTEYPDRVFQTVFSGENHFVLDNAKRFASTVKRVLTGSPI